MSAVAELAAPELDPAAFTPLGAPVRRGQLALARHRAQATGTPDGIDVAVVAGFGTAAWIGPPELTPPPLGRLTHRSAARLDGRGRLLLDRRVRLWLRVSDPDLFDVVLLNATGGGLLAVPVEDLTGRFAALEDR